MRGGGGGAKYFVSGPKFPPSQWFLSSYISQKNLTAEEMILRTCPDFFRSFRTYPQNSPLANKVL